MVTRLASQSMLPRYEGNRGTERDGKTMGTLVKRKRIEREDLDGGGRKMRLPTTMGRNPPSAALAGESNARCGQVNHTHFGSRAFSGKPAFVCVLRNRLYIQRYLKCQIATASRSTTLSQCSHAAVHLSHPPTELSTIWFILHLHLYSHRIFVDE